MKSRAEYAKPQRDTSPQTHPHRRSIGASLYGMQWRKWLFPPKVKSANGAQPPTSVGGWGAQPLRGASLHDMQGVVGTTTTQCDHCTICAGMWYAQRRRDAYPSSRHCNARRIERGVPLVGTPVRFGVVYCWYSIKINNRHIVHI